MTSIFSRQLRRKGALDTQSRPDAPVAAASAEQAGELLISRPRTWSAGAGRRFRVELDGRRVADLETGCAARVPVCPGRHVLRVRCRPISAATLSVDLAAHQTLRLMTYVTALEEIEIRVDDRRTGQGPGPSPLGA